MPKRSSDTNPSNNPPVERVQKKTERSHEENQERAYIAASRRADRSIEARVQSARMASEIHRKRTGKGFKISEEIVMKEEMYEEEDDDLPRQYRALAAHLQTSSAEMNHRLSAYLSNQVAMASWARQQEVNRMFAEQFPNAGQISQQLSNSVYFQPLQSQTASPSHPGPGSPQSPQPLTFHPVKYEQPEPNYSQTREVSTVAMSPTSAQEGERDTSPPGLTPTSRETQTPQTSATPTFFHPSTSYAPTNTLGSARSMDPSLSSFSMSRPSAFTSELPNEAKLMANIDMNDPLASAFFGSDDTFRTDGVEMSKYDEAPVDFAKPPTTFAMPKTFTSASQSDDYFAPNSQHSSKMLEPLGGHSTIGTPGGGEGDSWDSWVNTDDWNSFESAAR
jgi:hypothetical protein